MSEIEKIKDALNLADGYYIIPKTDDPEKWVDFDEVTLNKVSSTNLGFYAKLKWRDEGG